jgi:nitrous oxidase accessory protein NosD
MKIYIHNLILIWGLLFVYTQITIALDWKGAPKILNMSDAVRPGKTFRINGFGFKDSDKLEIAIERNIDGYTISEPSSGAIKPEIIQTDRNGNFIVSVLPLDALPGVYTVWVKNDAGWSRPKKLNAARALFLSEREAFEGLSIKVVGRNFECNEFGVSDNTETSKVRLNDGTDNIYDVRVTDLNPFCISFIITNIPQGEYFVEVSNDNGANWGRLDNGQKLTILEKPKGTPEEYDPLGMGVSWACHFNWTNLFHVPASDGALDVTMSVQSIVNKAGADKNGGVVYFPNGTYKIGRLDLPKNVVLKGESKLGTIISYCGKDKDFITCTGAAITDGYVGIANMSIIVPKGDTTRPDVFINLGQAAIWQGVEETHTRTASEMFICNVKMDYDLTETKRDRRGLPSSVIGRERYYIANCNFKGFRLESHNYVNEYVTVKNNNFEFGQGVFIYTADYLFLENNCIIGHTEINREKHGFMFRANAWVYHNSVSHTGSDEDPLNENWNDGEALCNETPGGNHNFGSIVSSSSNTIVAGKTAGPFLIPKMNIFNHLVVMIINGRGLGQYRRVQRIDTIAKKIILEKEWDVIPDSTSRFTLMNPNENTTYYKNIIYDNPKGYWLFGNSIDCVVADNISVNCDGVFIFCCRYVNPDGVWPMYYFVPNYFNRITGNIITGISRKSHRAGIGLNCTREDAGGSYYGVEAYANEIRNNYILGNSSEKALASVTEAPAVSGIFLFTTVSSSLYDGKDVAGDITNTLIEDNQLSNLSTGISLSRCIYGQVVRNNLLDKSIGIRYDDSDGSQNTKIIE